MKELYPIFLKLEGERCLVIGGGEVAERKIMSLLDCGAEVFAVSRSVTTELTKLAKKEKRLRLIEKSFDKTDLKDVCLVVAATDNKDVNREIFDESVKLGLLVNVVDQPELCNFYVPASFARGDLKVAISTAGKSPALAKKIRKELEMQFGEYYATTVECLGEIRKELLVKYPTNQQKRKEILNEIINSELIGKTDKLNRDELLIEMRRWI